MSRLMVNFDLLSRSHGFTSAQLGIPVEKTLQEELEKVQNRATRFVTRNYNFETGSMTKFLEQLKWESLKQRRKGSRLILFYKGLNGQASIPVDDLLGTLETIIQNQLKSHMLGLILPETIRDWNALPASSVTSAECPEDCISRFTSLIRSRE